MGTVSRVGEIQKPAGDCGGYGGSSPRERLDGAQLAMAFPHANGAWTTIVINTDLVRVVGW